MPRRVGDDAPPGTANSTWRMGRSKRMIPACRMNSGTQLVTLTGEHFLPALLSILHWKRQPAGVQRVFLYPAEDPRRSREPARRLERILHQVLPEVEVQRREGGPDVAAFQRQMEAWQEEFPEGEWILVLADNSRRTTWWTEAWLTRPRCRVVCRETSGDWLEFQRNPDGSVGATPLPDPRREAAEALPLGPLVRAHFPDEEGEADFRLDPSPAVPIPAPASLTAVTEAAITHEWRFSEAFRAAGANPGELPNSALFAQYVAAILLCLGLSPVISARRVRLAGSARVSTASDLWVGQGGRVVVLDLDLASTTEAQAHEEATTELPDAVQRAASLRRRLAGLATEWVLIRPCHRLSRTEAALARAHHVGVIDQAGCHELPSRLATLFGVPLGVEGADLERRLRQHLTETGRTRVFAPEADILRQQGRGAEQDPAWASADDWLERVLRERGQNWLLWTHRGNAYLRVPAEGRPSAGNEWAQLLAAIARLDAAEVRANPAHHHVVLEFPNRPEIRRWVAEWLQPFLNKTLRFADAQSRFAARARVESEAVQAAGQPAPRPGSPATPAHGTNPSPTSRPTSNAVPGRATPRAASSPRPGRVQRPRAAANPLADLDQALDAALGSGQ